MKIVGVLNSIENKILSNSVGLLVDETRISFALGGLLIFVGAFILPVIQIFRHFVICLGVVKEY